MLEVVVLTLLQAAAGPPADAPAPETPAAESTTSATETTEATERRNEGWRDQVRCRNRTSVGSRLGSRVCSTRRQDEKAAENARSAVDSVQRGNWVREP
ncbi:MAG: hypothetical protein JNJ73_18895 [Hyphomonadaceae bacterium]|nr:hypothetical protein [Hyphomonadaceae bacterium]